MTTVLRLERTGALWRARREVFDVVLDGAIVATVANGEAVSIAIAPGRHLVWLVNGRRRSASVTFDAGDGETAAWRGHVTRRGVLLLAPDPTAMPLRGHPPTALSRLA
jgi:hypothetical protein